MSPRTAALALVVATSCASVASADETQVCTEAADKGQTLRDDGRLVDAEAAFMQCSRQACPGIVRKQCAIWARDMDARIPTVVFRVARGEVEAAGAQVFVDGKAVSPALGGQGMALDPGTHGFRFELPGATPIFEDVVLHEGEKQRPITASFATAVPQPAQSPAPLAKPPEAPAMARELVSTLDLGVTVGGGLPVAILSQGSNTPILTLLIEASLRPIRALDAGLFVGVGGGGVNLGAATASGAGVEASGGYGRLEAGLRGRWHFVRAGSFDAWAGPELDVGGDDVQFTGTKVPSNSFWMNTLLLGGGLIAGGDFRVSSSVALGLVLRGFVGYGVTHWTSNCTGPTACGQLVPGGLDDVHTFFELGARVLWSGPLGRS